MEITMIKIHDEFRMVRHDRKIWAGGEVSVRLETCIDGNATIVAHIKNSDDIMELLMVRDAISRVSHNDVSLIMPYFPYARQDRVCNAGEALSAKVMASLINSMNFKTVTIWDAHSDVVPALLDRCINIHQESFVRNVPDIMTKTLIAPDAGAAKKVKVCADSLRVKYLTAGKTRDPMTGEITGSHIEADHISGDVLIVDDICDGGRTFNELAKVLRPKMDPGADLSLYVTHGIFSWGFIELGKHFSKIYTPNPWCDSSIVQKI